MKKKIPIRELYVRVSILLHGFNYSDHYKNNKNNNENDEDNDEDNDKDNNIDDSNEKKIKIKRDTFYFIIQTYEFVKDEEIREKLMVFLQTCHFIDNIYLRYYANKPFLSWRLNSMHHYRDIMVDSIYFLHSRNDINTDYDHLPISMKTQVKNPNSILIIPILYRIRCVKILITREEWNYVDYFSIFHERFVVKVDNFLINANNKK